MGIIIKEEDHYSFYLKGADDIMVNKIALKYNNFILEECE